MNAYQHDRFNVGRALGEDELRKFAPSVFATTAHPDKSERFRPIPTIEIVRGLEKEGFSVVHASQARARDESRRNFTKHLLRLRRLDDVARRYQVGDVIAEALLKNANDGTSAYDLFLGAWRIRCLNGLVTKLGNFDEVKVRHSGKLENVQAKVIEGTYRVLGHSEEALAAVEDWSRIRLQREEAQAFAKAAHVLRFAEPDGEIKTNVTPDQLLIPRRPDDTEPNLWNVFNVIQENAVKGGLQAVTDTGRRSSTREIKSVDNDVRVNRGLWVLATEFAKLKKAA